MSNAKMTALEALEKKVSEMQLAKFKTWKAEKTKPAQDKKPEQAEQKGN